MNEYIEKTGNFHRLRLNLRLFELIIIVSFPDRIRTSNNNWLQDKLSIIDWKLRSERKWFWLNRFVKNKYWKWAANLPR